MRGLLDTNVLIALLDSAHTMHGAAWAWLEEEIERGWASCPLTENGVVRIMSQPSYPNSHPAAEVGERLAEACNSAEHVFWPEDISLLTEGLIEWRNILGPRQLTDAYLLALAVRNGGRFVTFDERISTKVVPEAVMAHLHIIPYTP